MAIKASHILGLNARSQDYSYPYNKVKGKAIASSKLRTKKVLAKAGVPVPATYKILSNPTSISEFDWNSLPNTFVLKPSKGLGGEGIIVVKKLSKERDGDEKIWITASKEKVSVSDLQLHSAEILEGAYSLGNVPDVAFIEEYIPRHKAFAKYAFRGTPDIRVIVFNRIPVMSMIRLPTSESGGRANIHQGAIAAGVDIATGITTRAVWHDRYIKYKPGSKRKLHGIRIPFWRKILEYAVLCQEATGIGYLSVDFVLHPDKGPMVLEINYQPGLRIQMANKAGLKRRLERVEDLNVKDIEHGVNLGQALFASKFSERVRVEKGIRNIAVLEDIKVKTSTGKKVTVPVKIDTGAWSTSVDRTLAKDLGLLNKSNILWERKVRNSLGRENRQVIGLTFWLAGKKIKTQAGVSNRSRLKRPIIVGRKDLSGFMVQPMKEV